MEACDPAVTLCICGEGVRCAKEVDTVGEEVSRLTAVVATVSWVDAVGA